MVHSKVQHLFIKALPALVFIFIGAVCSYSIVTNRYKDDNWKYCIYSDGYGYYGYLPCVFILHRFDYKQIVSLEKGLWPDEKDKGVATPFYTGPGKQFDVCYAGVAVLLTPFFLIAYFLSFIFHQNMMGGYNVFFQESVSAASLFYMMVGLFFIRKLLKEYQIREPVILFTLLVVVFGTNLYYYATWEQSMSHQYSFGIMAMFLYYARKSITDSKLKYIIWMTITLALLVLIRPTNVISIAAIPFLAGSFANLKQFLNSIFRPKILLTLLGIAIIIYSPQIILWYFETGKPFIWSYAGQGFNFAHPHFLDILLSYRKGLFVYTPLIFIAMVSGLLYLLRHNLFIFLSFLLFFIGVTYLLSSWECWYYGGSYGLRAFIDFYPVFILGLAFPLNYARTWIKIILIASSLFCTYLNTIQTYQYTHFMLPYDGTDKTLYWRLFLKTNAASIPGLQPFPDSTKLSFYKELNYSYDFDSTKTFWKRNNNITGITAHSGKLAGFVSPDSNYTSALFLPVNKLPKDKDLYIYVTAWAKTRDRDADVSIAISVENKDRKGYFSRGQSIMNYVFNLDQWQESGLMAQLPAFKNPDDNIVVFVYGTRGITYIDDIDVRFGTLKDK